MLPTLARSTRTRTFPYVDAAGTGYVLATAGEPVNSLNVDIISMLVIILVPFCADSQARPLQNLK